MAERSTERGDDGSESLCVRRPVPSWIEKKKKKKRFPVDSKDNTTTEASLAWLGFVAWTVG